MSRKSQRRTWRLFVATVLGACLATSVPAATLTQTSGYDYDANGFLVKQIIEQGDADACVASVYTPDAYGRRAESRLRNCNGSAPMLSGAPTEAPLSTKPDAAFPDRDLQVNFKNPDDATDLDQRFTTQRTNVLSQTQRLKFDKRFGLRASSSDANGIVSQWAYDSLGRRTQEVRPDGSGTQWEYLYCSGYNAGTFACPTGAVWALRETPQSGATITLDANGVATVKTGTQNGPIRIEYHDAQGRTIRVQTQGFDGSAIYADKSVVRASSGITVKTSNPHFSTQSAVWTAVTRDILGRAIEVDTPVNSGGKAVATIAYSGLSVTTTSPDPNNDGATIVSTITRNRIGLIASVRDAAGKVLTHSYDPFGNRVQTVDVAGNVISTVFDVHGYGRPSSTYDPDLGVWSFTYDVLGDLKSRVTARGLKSTFAYDGLGRMITRGEPDLNSTWIYDACANGKGAICEERADDGFDRNYTYDTAGRATNVSVTLPGGAHYTGGLHYNADGRVDTKTYPGAGVTVTNAYVPTYGYLSTVTDATPGAASHPVYWTGEKFDAAGRPTQFTYGNNVRTTSSYFDDGHLNTAAAGLLVNGTSSNEVESVQYAYNLAGTLSNRLDNDAPGSGAVLTAYTYDVLARLTAEKRSGGGLSGTQSLTWTYDAIGNITSRTDSALQNGYVNVYNYNGSGSGSVLPHAVASVSGFVGSTAVPRYAYDADGNMLSGAGRSMAWNSFDQVQSVARGATAMSILYDTDHQRASEIETVNGAVVRTTNYVNPPNGGGMYFEREVGAAGTVEKSYISANGQVVAVRANRGGVWSTTYWHKDNLGSNVVVTDDSGHAVERLAYDPFGARRYANGLSDTNGSLIAQTTERGFTEHEHIDEVGLVNMNGRLYDPQLGRFLSADTIGSAFDSQGQNRYSYVRNSPTAYTDPSGHDETDPGFSAFNWTVMSDDELSGIGQQQSWTNNVTIVGAISQYRTVSTTVDQTMRIDDHWKAVFTFTAPSGMGSVPGWDDPRFSYDNPAYSGQILTTNASKTKSSIGETVAHTALDAASLYPGANVPASLASAAWSAWDGDWWGAGLSVVGAIPILGEPAAIAKIARNAERAEHVAVEVADVVKACGCCFAAGTPVLTESGPIPIELVQVGTKVQSRDEKTGEISLKPVTDLIRHDGRAIFSMVFVPADGKVTRIEVSDNHQFWVEGKGWIESGKVQRGMHLRGFDGKLATVANLQATGRTAMTYNFTVADNHTFYAGEHPVLVHNECACSLAAKELAEAAKAAGSESRAASVLMTRDGKMYSALSGEPIDVMHADVEGFLMGARGEQGAGKDIAEWHGACAEIGCINKALNDGADLEGAVMSTTRIYDSLGRTGSIKPACSSCSPLGTFFGITIRK